MRRPRSVLTDIRRLDYVCHWAITTTGKILMTLRKNNLKFKHARKSTWDSKLMVLDTTDLTIDEISKQIGMQHAWQKNKLYEKLPKLGKTYKSRR